MLPVEKFHSTFNSTLLPDLFDFFAKKMFAVSLSVVVTLKGSNTKTCTNPTCGHGGSSPSTHVVTTGTKGIDSRSDSRESQATSVHLSPQTQQQQLLLLLQQHLIWSLTQQKLRKRTTGIVRQIHTYCAHKHTYTHARKHREAAEWEKKALYDLWKRESCAKKVWKMCKKTTYKSRGNIWRT